MGDAEMCIENIIGDCKFDNWEVYVCGLSLQTNFPVSWRKEFASETLIIFSIQKGSQMFVAR